MASKRSKLRIFFIVTAVLLLLLCAAFASLHFYIQSNHFKDILVEKINASSPAKLRIGSFGASLINGVTLEDVEFSMEDMDGSVERVRVGFSISGLRRGLLEDIFIDSPVIMLTLREGESVKPGKSKKPNLPLAVDMPIRVGRLEISNARLLIVPAEGEPVEIGPFDAGIVESADGKSDVSLTGGLPYVGTRVALKTRIDINKLALEGGAIEIGTVDLSAIEAGLGPAFDIGGKLSSKIEISGSPADGYRLRYFGHLDALRFASLGEGRNAGDGALFGPLSGELLSSITISPHFAVFDGDLSFKTNSPAASIPEEALSLKLTFKKDIERLGLDIENFLLSSKRLGALELHGTVELAQDLDDKEGVRFDIGLKAKKLSLTNLSSLGLEMGFIPAEGLIKGSLSGSVKAKGSQTSRIYFDTDLTLKDFKTEELPEWSGGALRSIGLRARGSYDKKADLLILKTLSLKPSAGLGLVKANGRLKGIDSGELRSELTLFIGETTVKSLKQTLPGHAVKTLKEYGLDGTFKAEAFLETKGLKLKTKKRGSDSPLISGTIKATFSDGALETDDGSLAAEQVDLIIRTGFKADFETGMETARLDFNLDIESPGFDILYGAFYGDLRLSPPSIHANGLYDLSSDLLRFDTLDIRLGDIADLSLKGEISRLMSAPLSEININTEAAFEISALEQAFDLYIRDSFVEDAEILETLEVEGSSSALFRIKGSPGELAITGDLIISELALFDEPSVLSMESMNLALPIEMSYPATNRQRAGFSRKEEYGSLEIEGLSFGDISFDEIAAHPAIIKGDLKVASDIIVPLFAGRLSINSFRFEDLLTSDRKLSLALLIEDVGLTELGAAVGLPPFGGTLTGTIPKIELIGTTLTTEGEIDLKLFGGSIRVSDIRVEDILRPEASIRSNIELSDIDLAMATGAFEFGHISGILGGYVRDLVITGAQPESFTARIETKRVKGVSQKISVKALKNISVFSSGSAAVLGSGIYQFFKLYRYSKLGFEGRLKNDTFYLKGIHSEGNKDYLVKGSVLPPRVDVVSYGREVSFKEMVERLKRIEVAQ